MKEQKSINAVESGEDRRVLTGGLNTGGIRADSSSCQGHNFSLYPTLRSKNVVRIWLLLEGRGKGSSPTEEGVGGVGGALCDLTAALPLLSYFWSL